MIALGMNNKELRFANLHLSDKSCAGSGALISLLWKLNLPKWQKRESKGILVQVS